MHGTVDIFFLFFYSFFFLIPSLYFILFHFTFSYFFSLFLLFVFSLAFLFLFFLSPPSIRSFILLSFLECVMYSYIPRDGRTSTILYILPPFLPFSLCIYTPYIPLLQKIAKTSVQPLPTAPIAIPQYSIFHLPFFTEINHSASLHRPDNFYTILR